MYRSTILLAALGTVTACKRGPVLPDGDKVVARVGDGVITSRQLAERLSYLPPQERARLASTDALEEKKKLLDEMVGIEAAAAEARRRGYQHDPQVERMLQQQLVAKLLREEVDAKTAPAAVPDAQIQHYYEEHADEFRRPQEVRVSQVLVKDEAKAKKLAAEARTIAKRDATAKQKTFQEWVAKHSEDEPSKIKGGDLGFLDERTRLYPAPVVTAAFTLHEVGDISDVVKSDRGYHLLQLTQLRPAVVRSLAEVKPIIQQRLLRTLRGERTKAVMAEVRGKVKVEIDDQVLREVKPAAR
jgi:peptidyl-prolyl cis-trans isomerase C